MCIVKYSFEILYILVIHNPAPVCVCVCVCSYSRVIFFYVSNNPTSQVTTHSYALHHNNTVKLYTRIPTVLLFQCLCNIQNYIILQYNTYYLYVILYVDRGSLSWVVFIFFIRSLAVKKTISYNMLNAHTVFYVYIFIFREVQFYNAASFTTSRYQVRRFVYLRFSPPNE